MVLLLENVYGLLVGWVGYTGTESGVVYAVMYQWPVSWSTTVKPISTLGYSVERERASLFMYEWLV